MEIFGWILSILSIYGTYLNIKKNSKCFYIWLCTSSCWIIYDIHKHAYPQACLFFIYAILAVKGIDAWLYNDKISKMITQIFRRAR